jgi:hypothetical protein
MSINTTGSNYMSNTSILEWMELKTETLYGKMKTAMDQSNHRVAAEDALNDIKAKVDDLKASGADAAELRQSINDTIAKYGAEFPEVGEVLQPIADELSKRYEVAPRVRQQIPSNNLPGTRSGSMAVSSGSAPTGPGKLTPPLLPPKVKITSDDAERWTKEIGNKVDTLGKQDQLGLIYIQDFNSQLSRTKDTASALMAAADKASDNIVSHIG